MRHTNGERLVGPYPLVMGLVVLAGCSWTHMVTVENRTDGPITVRYKLTDLACPCLFADTAEVMGWGSSTVYHVDRSDSTIGFTLMPGAEAVLARTWNSTYAYHHEQAGRTGWRDNLAWLRVEGPGWAREHDASGLLAVARQSTARTTLVVRHH